MIVYLPHDLHPLGNPWIIPTNPDNEADPLDNLNGLVISCGLVFSVVKFSAWLDWICFKLNNEVLFFV